MRKIDIKLPSPSSDKLEWRRWERWLRKCEEATKSQGQKPTFDRNIYNRYKHFFYKSQSDFPFYGKCAYCERAIGNQHGDVEHFRPKGGVADKDNKMIEDHPGYYWLAYDWQNLLISCITCNQIMKGSHFPVINDNHARKPEEIPDEIPLLINPVSGFDEDDPAKHFRINIEGHSPYFGIISGITQRGTTCIELFKLNKQDQLLDGRRTAMEAAEKLIKSLKNDFKRGSINQLTVERIQEILQEKRPHSLAQISVVLNNYPKHNKNSLLELLSKLKKITKQE
jgi:uncharacterized protein (TIGR02646 family)